MLLLLHYSVQIYENDEGSPFGFLEAMISHLKLKQDLIKQCTVLSLMRTQGGYRSHFWVGAYKSYLFKLIIEDTVDFKKC